MPGTQEGREQGPAGLLLRGVSHLKVTRWGWTGVGVGAKVSRAQSPNPYCALVHHAHATPRCRQGAAPSTVLVHPCEVVPAPPARWRLGLVSSGTGVAHPASRWRAVGVSCRQARRCPEPGEAVAVQCSVQDAPDPDSLPRASASQTITKTADIGLVPIHIPSEASLRRATQGCQGYAVHKEQRQPGSRRRPSAAWEEAACFRLL